MKRKNKSKNESKENNMKKKTKESFEKSLLKVLEKYGYKTDGIQSLVIKGGVDKLLKINIKYNYIDYLKNNQEE